MSANRIIQRKAQAARSFNTGNGNAYHQSNRTVRPPVGPGNHFHSYSRSVRNHWSQNRINSQTHAPSGYSHTHGGNSHGHQFSNAVREHWGQYPGGYGDDWRGYYHSHGAVTGGGTSGGGMGMFNPYEQKLIMDGETHGLHDCVKCGNALGGGSQGNVANCVKCVDHMSAL